MNNDPKLLSLGAGFLLGLTVLGCALSIPQEPPVYLFSFFRDNGQDGLYLCWSRDGYGWTELQPPGNSFLGPEAGSKLMRDPCIARGPDGTFHMVWTTGWGKPPVIGYASSVDLLNWSPQREIPVMRQEPEACNAWEPELFYDTAKQRWLVFWATTIPGRFPVRVPKIFAQDETERRRRTRRSATSV